MTIPQQVLDAIREEARKEAHEVWLSGPNVPKYTEPLAWIKGYALCYERLKVAEWERERWIPVDERLPEQRTAVLVFAPEMNEPVACMYYDPDSETSEFGEWVSEPSGPARGGWSAILSSDVTHWKPLPSPPDNK